jgi:hemerythrin-like metal-binding protein
MDQLLEHTRHHFAEEERILAASEYPQLAHHRRLHRHLIETATQMKEGLRGGHQSFPALLDFLVIEW